MIRLRNIKLVLAGMLILPMGLVTVACSPIHADDPNRTKTNSLLTENNLDTLKARLQTTIPNEEITQDQVDKAIVLLKKEFPGHDRNPAKLESIKGEIAAAVESGEITQEEADSKLAGLEEGKEKGKKSHGKRHHHNKTMIDIEDIKAKVSDAVESGEITQKEADAKLAYIEAKRNSRQEKMAAKLESIKGEIAAAVESGEITQEEADSKLAGLEEGKEKGKKWHGKRHHHNKTMMDIEDIKAKVSDAVESGEITQKEATNKLRYLERQPKKVTY